MGSSRSISGPASPTSRSASPAASLCLDPAPSTRKEATTRPRIATYSRAIVAISGMEVLSDIPKSFLVINNILLPTAASSESSSSGSQLLTLESASRGTVLDHAAPSSVVEGTGLYCPAMRSAAGLARNSPAACAVAGRPGMSSATATVAQALAGRGRPWSGCQRSGWP